jgi:all-trans-8'-apo-beta-carotenal 15,15'-oxygenase
MTTILDRRELLTGAALASTMLIVPEIARAGTVPKRADWTLGVADVMDDIAPRKVSLVHGKAPAGLRGTLYRNGPARFRRGDTANGHWFDGDGMIRSWRVDGGNARLAARFVDTPKRRLEQKLGRVVIPGFGTESRPGAAVSSNDDTNPANTSIISAGGDMLALWEAGSPAVIDPETLATKGFRTFKPDLTHMPFLAHPRIEPDGRIWNLGLSGKAALVWRLSAAGSLEATQMVPLPRASYLHDFTATARHLVIVLQPWIQDKFDLPFVDSLSWRPSEGTQVLVIDKDDLSKRRIYDLPTFAFFHLGDAWEESDGTIRFDGCFETSPYFGQHAARELIAGRFAPGPMPVLTMVALHPDGKASLTASNVGAEFPRVDPALAGLPRTKTVHVGGYSQTRPFAQSVGVWDWKSGHDDAHHFGANHLVEEFVPVADRIDGARSWLIGTTVNLAARATELHVFNAAQVAAGPVCTWRADVALPVSFHGTFVSA